MERRFRTQEPAFAYQTPESALAPASMYNETPVFTFTPAPVQQTPERMLYFGVCFPNAGPQCQLRRYESKRRSSLLLQRRTLRRWSCLRLRRRTKHDAIVARGSGVILARHRSHATLWRRSNANAGAVDNSGVVLSTTPELVPTPASTKRDAGAASRKQRFVNKRFRVL